MLRLENLKWQIERDGCLENILTGVYGRPQRKKTNKGTEEHRNHIKVGGFGQRKLAGFIFANVISRCAVVED